MGKCGDNGWIERMVKWRMEERKVDSKDERRMEVRTDECFGEGKGERNIFVVGWVNR